MKVLVATHRTQGQEPGDFTWGVPGELVRAGEVCARDEADPDGGCGCGRSWVGLGSGLATTTAIVAELDMSRDDYVRAHLDAEVTAVADAGADTPDAARPTLDVEHVALVQELAAELLDVAADYPLGAVLGRRLDDVVVRG